MPTPDEPQHAVRDGDYRLIYVVGKKGLYKYFPDSNIIEMFKPVDTGAGEQGYMVGYGELTTFPPAGGVRILIPTRENVTPGGLWVLEQASVEGVPGSHWVLKNGRPGANPLPAGWGWTQVAASPKNGNTIIMYGCSAHTGDSGDSPVRGTAQWPGGFFQDVPSGLSPVWMTNDGGDNWFEVPLPVSYISPNFGVMPQDARIYPDKVRLTYNNFNTPLIVANVRGLTNFFGSLLDGLVHWYGNPVDLNVIANDFDGTGHRFWDEDGYIYFGHIHTDPYGISYGQDGQAIISASWGDAYGAHVGWSADISTPPYPDAIYLPGPALQSIDTLGVSTAIVGIADGDVYYSPDYHTAEPTMTVEKSGPSDAYRLVVATADGIVAASATGLYHINDVANGSAPVLGIATSPVTLTSSRQKARRIVAGRMTWVGSTGDDALVAKFVVFDGDSWLTVDGPSDADSRNVNLSITAIAVTEG